VKKATIFRLPEVFESMLYSGGDSRESRPLIRGAFARRQCDGVFIAMKRARVEDWQRTQSFKS
jgi:hypothetical protein